VKKHGGCQGIEFVFTDVGSQIPAPQMQKQVHPPGQFPDYSAGNRRILEWCLAKLCGKLEKGGREIGFGYPVGDSCLGDGIKEIVFQLSDTIAGGIPVLDFHVGFQYQGKPAMRPGIIQVDNRGQRCCSRKIFIIRSIKRFLGVFSADKQGYVKIPVPGQQAAKLQGNQ